MVLHFLCWFVSVLVLEAPLGGYFWQWFLFCVGRAVIQRGRILFSFTNGIIYLVHVTLINGIVGWGFNGLLRYAPSSTSEVYPAGKLQ